MKNMLNNFKWYRIVVIILLTVLFIILVISIYSQYKKNEQLLNNIIGTYQTEENNEKSSYIVFTRDKKYIYYKQFKYIDSGKYKQNKSDKRIYELISKNKKNDSQVLLYGKKLYRSRIDYINLEKFIKIDDTPTFLNLKHLEK